MKNTGIVYHSTERTPTVLAELAGLLPPLSGEQLAALEAAERLRRVERRNSETARMLLER